MDLPNTYTNKNETNCCAIPNVDSWDMQQFKLNNMHFIREYTRSFLFMPLNMSSAMQKLQTTAARSGKEMSPKQALILSRDLSPWKAEQLYRVAEPVEGEDNVTIQGTYQTMVFEGPYKNAKNWCDAALAHAQETGKKAELVYFFYTTCPKCAKHYGKNYVITFAKV